MKMLLIGWVVGVIMGGAGGGYVAYTYLGSALKKAQAALAALKA